MVTFRRVQRVAKSHLQIFDHDHREEGRDARPHDQHVALRSEQLLQPIEAALDGGLPATGHR